MANPQVIWAKKVTIDQHTYLVRAVHVGAGVEFEHFQGKDAMDQGTWLDIDRIQGFRIEVISAIREAFIGDAAVRLAENPMIQGE